MRLPVATLWLLITLGCATRSQGEVTLTVLPSPLTLYDPTNGDTTFAPVDLNGDGEADYTFGYGFSIAIRTERFNRIIIHEDPPPNLGGLVEPLANGYLIASSLVPGDAWVSSDLIGGYVSPGESNFTPITICLDIGCESRMPVEFTRVSMGLEFVLSDGLHYGYLDVEARHDAPGVILYGWAWETTPNTPITAGATPEPSRAMLLLPGVVAAIMFRRRHK